ncbi:MAG: HyaD/HybD family hydrogenase maturation endopeptidase [Thermodesulfobacteriota bacterium]
MDNKIPLVVLGIGNILMSDDGVGVRVAQELDKTWDFPAEVEIVDGGVLGLSLLSVLESAGRLIVVDAVRLGGRPGDLYRLPWEELKARTRYKDSLHQIDFVETMAVLPLIGTPPPTIIIGVEPADVETFSLNLSPVVAGRLPDLCRMVLEELKARGFEPRPKENINDVPGGTGPDS